MDQQTVEVLPFLANRYLNQLHGGRWVNNDLSEVFGLNGWECLRDPLDI